MDGATELLRVTSALVQRACDATERAVRAEMRADVLTEELMRVRGLVHDTCVGDDGTVRYSTGSGALETLVKETLRDAIVKGPTWADVAAARKAVHDRYLAESAARADDVELDASALDTADDQPF